MLRLYELTRRILAAGHSVELWVFGGTPAWPDPRPRGLSFRELPMRPRRSRWKSALSRASKEAWLFSSPDARAAARAIQPDRFDIIVLERSYLSPLLSDLRAGGVPLVLDADNVEGLLARQVARLQPSRKARMRARVNAARIASEERALVRCLDVVVACSDEDLHRFQAMRTGATLVVHRNGIDPYEVPWCDHSRPRGARCLMLGSLDYPPNIDACIWLAQEIMPALRSRVPDAVVRLVGRSPTEQVRNLHDPDKGVVVVGEVSDSRAELEQADMMVIPLRLGSGTRFKAIEALASGLPVVSTPLGIEGLGLLGDGLALVADTAQQLAEQMARALEDTEIRRRMSRDGRRHVELEFDWNRIAAEYMATLQRALDSTQSTRHPPAYSGARPH